MSTDLAITVGQHLNRPQGKRLVLDKANPVGSLAMFLTRTPPGEETWWSGHLWEGNTRKKPVAWQGMGIVLVDVDYYGDQPQFKQRHQPPTASDKAKFERAARELVTSQLWHHTPRGARFAWVLDGVLTDWDEADRVTKRFASHVNQALFEGDCAAALDSRKKPFGGYLADAQTQDQARVMMMPNAYVKGFQRRDEVHLELDRVFDSEMLSSLSVSDQNTSDISKLLLKMECEGDGDGSMALMRVARKACFLGVQSKERFLIESHGWNKRRQAPWSKEDLARRFEDAHERYVSEGKVAVPYNPKTGKPVYSVSVLDDILNCDRKFADQWSYSLLGAELCLGGRALEEHDMHNIRSDITKRYGYANVPRDDVRDCALALAKQKPVNPVVEYLQSLEWDGQSRIASVAQEVMSVDPQEHPEASTYIRRWFISAVARAFQPGCKVDTVLVLRGEMGTLKSTFFRVLTWPWFSDTHIDILAADKDAYMTINSVWCYEFAEFSGIYRKADFARVRNFLSSPTDLFRAPYDKRPARRPRPGVVVGTANEMDILRDPEGSRRFWVINVRNNEIDVSKLRSMRDQLWAEAVQLYNPRSPAVDIENNLGDGEQWWLTREEDQLRAEANEAYEPESVGVDQFMDIIESLENRPSSTGWLRVIDIARESGHPSDDLPRDVQLRIAQALRKRGYEKGRAEIEKDGRKRRIKIWTKRAK